MDFNEYQAKARRSARYSMQYGIIYPTLGLAGEAGEVAEKVKKVLRDNAGVFDPAARDSIILELGDVLWYISQIAMDLGFDLDFVARININKLESRMLRDTIQGSGDTR